MTYTPSSNPIRYQGPGNRVEVPVERRVPVQNDPFDLDSFFRLNNNTLMAYVFPGSAQAQGYRGQNNPTKSYQNVSYGSARVLARSISPNKCVSLARSKGYRGVGFDNFTKVCYGSQNEADLKMLVDLRP